MNLQSKLKVIASMFKLLEAANILKMISILISILVTMTIQEGGLEKIDINQRIQNQ